MLIFISYILFTVFVVLDFVQLNIMKIINSIFNESTTFDIIKKFLICYFMLALFLLLHFQNFVKKNRSLELNI